MSTLIPSYAYRLVRTLAGQRTKMIDYSVLFFHHYLIVLYLLQTIQYFYIIHIEIRVYDVLMM